MSVTEGGKGKASAEKADSAGSGPFQLQCSCGLTKTFILICDFSICASGHPLCSSLDCRSPLNPSLFWQARV